MERCGETRRVRVSVVMPAYNSARHIAGAIDSVRAQTVSDWELLIVDDGSTDGTDAVIARCAQLDSRIRCFTMAKNRGAAFCRAFAVERAAGAWVAFLDSDDLWLPDKLEKQLAFARRSPEAKLIFTGAAFLKDGAAAPGRYWMQVPERIGYRALLRQNVIPCSSVLVRRSCLRDMTILRTDIHEDFAVWLQILRREPFAYGVNEPLVVYRVSRASRSGDKRAAAAMTFRTYRAAGLPVGKAAFCFCSYAARSVRKYAAIFLGENHFWGKRMT